MKGLTGNEGAEQRGRKTERGTHRYTQRAVGREKKVKRKRERQPLTETERTEKRAKSGNEEETEEEKRRRRGGWEEREGQTAFHSHAITLTGEFSVLSQRNTDKSSTERGWKLKPVHSCQTAPSASVSQGVRAPRAPLPKAQLPKWAGHGA